MHARDQPRNSSGTSLSEPHKQQATPPSPGRGFETEFSFHSSQTLEKVNWPRPGDNVPDDSIRCRCAMISMLRGTLRGSGPTLHREFGLRRLWAIGVIVCCFWGCSEALAVGPAPIPLWPEGAPGKAVGSGEEEDTRPSGSTRPRSRTGRRIVICPGGGYGILAYDHEGTQIAQWLNSIGVTGWSCCSIGTLPSTDTRHRSVTLSEPFVMYGQTQLRVHISVSPAGLA